MSNVLGAFYLGLSHRRGGGGGISSGNHVVLKQAYRRCISESRLDIIRIA